MLNLILGKSKTGKTSYIYSQIEEDIKDGARVILFVPSQSRAKAENEYMKTLNKKGVIGVNITTISEFISEELKNQNLHIAENYMTKLDRKVILTQVIKENPELFNVFSKVKTYPGFLDVLDIYMDLFRKSEIEPEDVKNMVLEDKRTNSKFQEILSVYAKYLEKIRAEYIDSVDEMEMFVKAFSKSEWFKDRNVKVYCDAYNNFSNSEFKLLNKIMKEEIDLTITLNTDISKYEEIIAGVSSSIFETTNETYLKLLSLANKNDTRVDNVVLSQNHFKGPEDIKFIANNVFAETKIKEGRIETPNIETVMHTNVLKEVEAVANNIASLVKQGYRYQDFAIYTTNIDEYYKVISRAFYENGLEIYAAKSKSITDSILTKYIQSILNLSIKGFNLELIFETLKLGLTDVDLKEVYLLENYMREFNVNKYLVKNKFTLNDDFNTYDLEKINDIKDRIVNIFDFVNEFQDATAEEIIVAIYEHLEQNHIFENFKEIIVPLEKDAINIDMNNFETQVWGAICQVFDSIVRVYKDQKLTMEEFSNVFTLVVKDIKIKTLPPTKDQIELLDINSSKVEPKKIAFFIGVVEGKFPKKEDEDIFFNDSELEALKEKNLDVKETTVSKLNMGFFNIYEALNNIEEKLYIYIPSSTLDGKATRKSSLITLIEQIANLDIRGEITKGTEDNIFAITSKDDLFMWLIKSIRSFDDLTEEDRENVVSVYEYFQEDSKYMDILKFKKDDSPLSKEITDILYSNEFKSSVSKLELYKKCPFSYFMQYILKVMPNKDSKVNVLELGSFMHAVLETYSNILLERHVNWKNILTEDLEELLPEYDKLLKEVISDALDENLSKQKQSVRYNILKTKLTKTMRRVMKTIAISFSHSAFEPYGYEIEFKDNGIFLPMEIQVSDTRIMKIIGKIDRVDTLELDGKNYLRVVDYKSSGKSIDLKSIREGLSLQLISYMMAFKENLKDENFKPAGIVYFNLSDKLVSMSQYENSQEKIKEELIKNLRMNGIFLNDVDILKKMDYNFDTKDSLIDITGRSLKNRSLEAAEFEELCNETKKNLESIGKCISDGIVKIAPNKKADHCKYCQYSATCRRNLEV